MNVVQRGFTVSFVNSQHFKCEKSFIKEKKERKTLDSSSNYGENQLFGFWQVSEISHSIKWPMLNNHFSSYHLANSEHSVSLG